MHGTVFSISVTLRLYTVIPEVCCWLTNEKQRKTDIRLTTEPRKGHFFSNIYQTRSWNKKNWKRNQNNNISFKRLIIFSVQYWTE